MKLTIDVGKVNVQTQSSTVTPDISGSQPDIETSIKQNLHEAHGKTISPSFLP